VTDESPRSHAELLSVLIMSVATVVTAWCASQAQAWSGTQTFRMAASNHLYRTSLEARVEGNQVRLFDAAQYMAYAAAKTTNNEPLSRFFHDHLRPEVQVAIDTAASQGPARSVVTPSHVTSLPDYDVPQYASAVRFARGADACQRDARTANDVGDGYTNVTVLLAMVLLLAGTASRLGDARLRWTFLGGSGVLLVACTAWAATRPIAAVEIHRGKWLSALCTETVVDALAQPE
jgi:hypothetical protein